jgi:hypothetical protein
MCFFYAFVRILFTLMGGTLAPYTHTHIYIEFDTSYHISVKKESIYPSVLVSVYHIESNTKL